MQLNVVLLNSLIKAINHTYDILIIRVEFDMLLLAIGSVFFEGGSVLDLPHKKNRFFYFLALCGSMNKTFFMFIYILVMFFYFCIYFFFLFSFRNDNICTKFSMLIITTPSIPCDLFIYCIYV